MGVRADSPEASVKKSRSAPGEGGVTLTEGEIEGEVQVGDQKVLQKFQAFDTDAF